MIKTDKDVPIGVQESLVTTVVYGVVKAKNSKFSIEDILFIRVNLLHSIVTSLVWLQPVLAVLGQVLLSTKQESEFELIILEIQIGLDELPGL